MKPKPKKIICKWCGHSKSITKDLEKAYQQGKADMLESIIQAEKNQYYCDEELCGESKSCSDCMVKYLEQLKKQNK